MLGDATPLGTALSMMSELQAKIVKEGQVAQTQYAEFTAWCKDRSTNLGFEIKTGKSEVTSLKASIGQEVASLSVLSTKVEELIADIATDEADAKAAGQIRETEAADFAAEETELMETINMLQRAIRILEREMSEGGVAMVQMKNAGSLAQLFDAMVRTLMITSGEA